MPIKFTNVVANFSVWPPRTKWNETLAISCTSMPILTMPPLYRNKRTEIQKIKDITLFLFQIGAYEDELKELQIAKNYCMYFPSLLYKFIIKYKAQAQCQHGLQTTMKNSPISNHPLVLFGYTRIYKTSFFLRYSFLNLLFGDVWITLNK